jgi:hypothetical protein
LLLQRVQRQLVLHVDFNYAGANTHCAKEKLDILTRGQGYPVHFSLLSQPHSLRTSVPVNHQGCAIDIVDIPSITAI